MNWILCFINWLCSSHHRRSLRMIWKNEKEDAYYSLSRTFLYVHSLDYNFLFKSKLIEQLIWRFISCKGCIHWRKIYQSLVQRDYMFSRNMLKGMRKRSTLQSKARYLVCTKKLMQILTCFHINMYMWYYAFVGFWSFQWDYLWKISRAMVRIESCKKMPNQVGNSNQLPDHGKFFKCLQCY